MPGDLALAYVRLRKTEGGDFDRAQRQQQVIMGIRTQILNHKLLPTLISKAPVLYNELSTGIRTNLSLDQAIRLAWLASQIPEENIKHGADRCTARVICQVTRWNAGCAQADHRENPRLAG